MFEILRSPSRSAAGAILFVTVGILLVIWSGLWYLFFLKPDPAPPAAQTYVCVSIILSGVAIAVIGLLFGLIGRKAKSADNSVGIAAATPAAPVVTSGGSVVNASPAVTDIKMSNSPRMVQP